MKRKLALIVLVCLSLFCTAFVACDTEIVIHAHELEKVVALAPTCETSGNIEYYRCTSCDKIFADEDYSVITVEETVIPATGHSYDEVVVVDPTCTEDGYTNHVCHCGDSYATDPVPATGHSYDSVVVTEPTCTEKGYTTHTCHCGDSYVDSYVDASGHDYGKVVVTEPTCIEKGYTTHTCSVCDDSYVDSYVDANGHDYESVVTEPTCTEKGYTTHTCSVCDDSYVDSYVNAKGHDYKDVITEPTCTEKGYTTHTCACGEAYVDSYVDAKGHDHKAVVTAPTCTEKGYTTYTCTACGDSYVDSYVDAKGHDHKAVVTAPTCTEKGYTTYTCTACGDSYVDNYVDAKGHDYNKVVTAPTCTNDGYTTYTCTVCGDTYKDDTVDALGHSYEEDVIEPTCTEKGYTTYTCTVCGHSYNDDYVDELGHSFDDDGVCTECGAVRAKDYYIQLAQSWRDFEGFSITVKNFNFVVEGRNKLTEAFQLNGSIKQIDVAELVLYVEDGKLCGGAHGKAYIYNGPIPDYDAVCEFTAVISGDDVYIVLAYGREEADQTYEIKLSVDYLVNYLFEMSTGGADVSVEQISSIIDFVTDTVLPAIDTLIQSDVEGVNGVLENLFNIIFTFEEQEDHTFVAKLDYEKIHALNDNLAEKSIADVIDVYFGEGTYKEVSDWLKGLLDLTIGDVIDGIDELGLKSSDLIEKANELLADLGAEDFDLQEVIDHYSDKVIRDLLGEEYENIFIDAIDYLQEVTLYELFGSAEDIHDAISSVIDTVSDGCDLSLVTNSKGVLEGVNVNADEVVYEADYARVTTSFELSIALNEKLEITWSNIVDDISDKIVLPSKDIFDGDVESWSENGGSTSVSFGGKEYYAPYTLVLYLNVTADSPDGILIMPDCRDWLYYDVMYAYREYKFLICALDDETVIMIDEYSKQAVKVTISENGLTVLKESGEEYELEFASSDYDSFDEFFVEYYLQLFENPSYEITYDSIHGESYYYNPETGEYAEESQHDFEYEYTLHGETCKDGCTVVTTCKNCDYYDEFTRHWCDTNWGEIDLSDYDCCGGWINYSYCPVCDTYDYINCNLYKCHYEYEEEALLDDDGNEIGMCSTYTCNRCDIIVVIKQWKVYDSACEGTSYKDVSISIGETTIFEGVAVSSFTQHDYKVTDVIFDVDGGTCEDGYSATYVCTKCGDSYEGRGWGHGRVDVEIDLSDYDCCGGWINYSYCPVCDTVRNINFYFECDLNYEKKEILNESGETIGWTYINTCTECGIKVIDSSWSEYRSACEGTSYHSTAIYIGEECIECLTSYDFTEHDYEYTYEPIGDDCEEDGYWVISTCSKCGDTDSYRNWGHRYEYLDIKLSEFGLCYGEISIRYCSICDKVFNSYAHEYCNWEQVETTEDGTIVYTCQKCGATKHCSPTKVRDEDCNCTTTETIVYYNKAGEAVAEYVNTYTEVEHDYITSVEYDGETCDDGYTITYTCSNCGDSYSEHGRGHSIESNRTDLSKFGLCGGEIHEEYCIVCKQVLGSWCDDTSCEWEYSESTDHGEIYKCTKCGAKREYSITESEKDENCQVTVTDATIYYNADGKEVYRDENVHISTAHNYELTYILEDGKTCDDGYTVIITCTDCGDVDSWENRGHRWTSQLIDSSELGLCYGEIYENYCLLCNQLLTIECYDCCRELVVTTADGVKIYLCQECGITKHYSQTQSKDGNCNLTTTTTVTYYDKNEEVIYNKTASNTVEAQHDYRESSIKLNGKTCDDGYTVTYTCSNCGDKDEQQGWGHRYETNYVYLSEYGLCDGEICTTYCSICDKVLDSYCYDYCMWEWIEETEEYTEYRCWNCNSVKRCYETYKKLEDGCIYGIVDTIVYCNSDGEELCRYDDLHNIRNQEEKHNYKTTVEFDGETCDDGYMVTRTCLDCGRTENDWGWGHQVEPVDTDLAEYGLCGGNVHTEYCTICNQILDTGYSENCIWELLEEAENGDAIYQCWRCKATKHLSVSVGELADDDCYRNITKKIAYRNSAGDEVYSFEVTEREYHNYEYTYEPNGETCDDGYTVISKCLDCGETYVDRLDGHSCVIRPIDLSTLGLCDGRIYEDYCIVCEQSIGALVETTCEWELQETTEDGYTVYECSICHAKKYYKVTEETIGCQFIKTTTTIYYNADGEIVYTNESSNTWDQHNYEYTYILEDGKTCEDGYTVIYACTNCDVSWEWQEWSHRLTPNSIDLYEHGLCVGWINEDYCLVCKQSVNALIETTCNWELQETTEYGKVYKCSNCGAEKHYLVTDSEKDDDCQYIHTETTIYYNNGGEEVYKNESAQVIFDPNIIEVENVKLELVEGVPYLQITVKFVGNGTVYPYLYNGNSRISFMGEEVVAVKGNKQTISVPLTQLTEAETEYGESFEGIWMDIRVNTNIRGTNYTTNVIVDADSAVAEVGSTIHDANNVYTLHYYVRNSQVELKVFFRAYQYTYSIDVEDVDGVGYLVIKGQLADSLSADFAKLAGGTVSIGDWDLEGTIAADGSWKISAKLEDIEMGATVAGAVSFESADGSYAVEITANNARLDIAACENAWTYGTLFGNPRYYYTTKTVNDYEVIYGSDWNEPFLKVEYLGTKITFDKLELVAENDKPYAVFSGTLGAWYNQERLEATLLEIGQVNNGFDFQQYSTWNYYFAGGVAFEKGLPEEITIIYNENGTFQLKVDLSGLNDTNGWYIHLNGFIYNAEEWTKGQSITIGKTTYTLDTGENSGNSWASAIMTIWVTNTTEWELTFDKFELIADNDTPYAVLSGTCVSNNASEESFTAKFLEIAQADHGFNLQQYTTWSQLFVCDDFANGLPDLVTIVYNGDGTFQIKVDISSLNTDNGWFLHLNGSNYTVDGCTIGQSITVGNKTYTLGTGENSGNGWASSLITIWVTEVAE